MFKRIVRNGMRRPAYSIAVVLVTAVLTIVLCYLHRTGETGIPNHYNILICKTCSFSF